MKPSLHHSLFKTVSVIRKSVSFRAASNVRVGKYPLLILEQLYHRDGLTADAMAAACEMSGAQLRQSLDKLEREQLVTHRENRFFLTDEGRLSAGWVVFLLDDMEELLAVGLSEEEQRRLMELLSRVYQNLRGEPIYPQIG